MAATPRAVAITAEEEKHVESALQVSPSQSPSSSPSSRETGASSLQEDGEDIGPPRSVRNVPGVDSTITSRVFMDFGLCPTATRPGRTLGNRSIVCDQADELPLGRVVIGLYGKQAPQSVAQFVAMCNGSAGSTYAGTLIHRIVPGQYIQGGRQGAADKGEVTPPSKLSRNQESVSSSAFKLRHTRPGTVSLCLSVNDDTDAQRKRMGYQSVEFLITTGPGPAPELDNANIVIGTVLEGLDVITRIAAVPTYQPGERIRQLNNLAQFFGDQRAASARSTWSRPLKAVVVRNAGVVDVGKPGLPAMLP
eukprot:TRINITY_DN2655_c0_g2_i1.p1 TRINITY_DN2655_c0_g2~~TRINITY_DN2655_c0_g2_i1.p1  ORF type:complete len:333 (+),score=34.62 TRINITY_DN2655_c0_g2_i1:81-1001(+)